MVKKVFAIILFTAASVAAVFVYKYPPAESHYYPPCIFKKMTGYDCAGCGSARATYALLHGQPAAAADYNILLLALLPIMGVGLLHFFTGTMKTVWMFLNRPLLLLVVIVLFWGIRNISWVPFLWLHSDK